MEGRGHHKPTQGRAFTLVELLVVVAIIAILAALLLPVVSRVKQRSQGVWCENNLRQLQVGWHLYSDDFGGRLVRNQDRGTRRDLTWAAGWLNNKKSSPDNTNEVHLTGALLGSYTRTAKIYKCPGDRSVDKGNHLPRVRSVSMNAYMNGYGMGINTNYLNYRTAAEIDAPAARWVFMDEREDSINDCYFRVGLDEEVVRDFPASYHNWAGALSFADGHNEIHKWKTPNVTKPIQTSGDITSSEPALGNEDMKWLQERTSSRR